jgi:hypothetical protein
LLAQVPWSESSDLRLHFGPVYAIPDPETVSFININRKESCMEALQAKSKEISLALKEVLGSTIEEGTMAVKIVFEECKSLLPNCRASKVVIDILLDIGGLTRIALQISCVTPMNKTHTQPCHIGAL